LQSLFLHESMKMLKYILAVIILISAVFLSVGFFNDNVTYETRVEVNKPLKQCFIEFNNPFNLKKWLTGFKSIEHISGLPNHAGSQWKLTFEEDGKEFIMTETVTAFEPNELFAFIIENEMLTTEVEVRFIEEDSKTIITSTNKVVGKNIIMRSTFPFFKSHFQEHAQGNYDKLKKLIEKTEQQNSLFMRWILNQG